MTEICASHSPSVLYSIKHVCLPWQESLNYNVRSKLARLVETNQPKLKSWPNWSVTSVSRHFESTARNAEIYLERCKEGAKARDGYKKLHDEHVAKFYLYNYLHGRTFLDSPQSLWSELQRLLVSPPSPPSECFESDWFAICYASFVRAEMRGLEVMDS